MTQVQRINDDGPVLAKITPSDAVWRSFDANDINPILNHPDVFPAISVPGHDKYDVTPLVANPLNVLMMSEGGGILFAKQEPHIYEVHTNFLPQFRGRHALRASLSAYRWIFCHTDCETILTRIPAFNRAADLWARKAGFRFMFQRDKAWPTKDGGVDLKFYALRIHDWIWSTPSLAESGVRFHRRLDEERKRFNLTDEGHADDHSHDIAVGACAEMIFGGEPEKGAYLFNSYAAFAGYGTIGIVSRNPLLIDIGNAVLQIENETFKVLIFK